MPGVSCEPWAVLCLLRQEPREGAGMWGPKTGFVLDTTISTNPTKLSFLQRTWSSEKKPIHSPPQGYLQGHKPQSTLEKPSRQDSVYSVGHLSNACCEQSSLLGLREVQGAGPLEARGPQERQTHSEEAPVGFGTQ